MPTGEPGIRHVGELFPAGPSDQRAVQRLLLNLLLERGMVLRRPSFHQVVDTFGLGPGWQDRVEADSGIAQFQRQDLSGQPVAARILLESTSLGMAA